MENEITLDGLIAAADESLYNSVERVYSSSKHADYAKNVMNVLLTEKKQWRNILLMLSVYPVQQWASSARHTLHIDIDTINSVIDSEDYYFGIRDRASLTTQQESLHATDQAMSLIRGAIEDDTCRLGKDLAILQAVHGVGYPDVSKYLMSNKYEAVLRKVCAHLARAINAILKPIEQFLMDTDEDILFVYHDASLLVELGNDILPNRSDSRKVDPHIVKDSIYNSIKALKTYPFGGKEIFEIVFGRFQGATESEIAGRLGRSRTFMRSRYKEGTAALGYIIWGYTTPQILNMP